MHLYQKCSSNFTFLKHYISSKENLLKNNEESDKSLHTHIKLVKNECVSVVLYINHVTEVVYK